MSRRQLLLATSLAALLAACAVPQHAAPALSITDTIAKQPELSTLNKLIVTAGLADTLKAPGPFTIFAPTNEAFKAVPAKTMDELGRDPAKLKAVLAYHVVPAKLSAAEIKNASIKTAQGGNVSLSKAGHFVTVDDAVVQQADITATNGVVHTVDRVLMPAAAR